jgi:DNA repair protein RecN (Recombination protein N)
VGDVSASLRDYAEGINASPERLAEIEDRLAASIASSANTATPWPKSSRSAKTSPASWPKSKTRTRSSRRCVPFSIPPRWPIVDAAAALHDERKSAANKLAKLAEAQINSLAMKVRFEIAVSASGKRKEDWTASGWDTVEYRIATNPGEPLKPLDEIASGGEMSRVMLALKVSVEEGAAKPKKKTAARARWSSMRSTSASAAAPRKPWDKS